MSATTLAPVPPRRRASSGMSAATTTAISSQGIPSPKRTPRMRPRAHALRTVTPWIIPGIVTSSTYRAAPVTLALPSLRGGDWPMDGVAMEGAYPRKGPDAKGFLLLGSLPRMPTVREPVIQPIPIDELRPTQITVGMREVKAKRKRWREIGGKKGAEFLGKHMIPVVLGPKDRHYVIDHHHLSRALHDEGVKNVLVTVVAKLSKLEAEAFWFVMDNRNWMHPFDDKGRRRPFSDLP